MKKRLSKMAALVSALALLFTTIACDLPSAKDPTQEETQTQEETPTQEAPTPVLKPAATPTITVENNTVTITSTTKNAKIYYTVDGTAPSTESTEYTKPFAITARTTVKAIATAKDFDKSEVATKECEYVKPVTAKPLIKNTDNSITITCETEAAVIYYTTDGTEPTTESTKYTEAFIITADTTVQAFASAEGFAASEIVKEELEYVAPGSVGTPKIEQNGNSVTITCATTGATIYYTTDGSEPTTASTEYTAAITLTEDITIKAFAVKADCTDSLVASEVCTYTAPKATKPVITLENNKVTITAEGFDIYYTIDGSEPSTTSTKYSAPFDLTAGDTDITVKAIAVKEGYTNSDIAEKACSYVAPTPAPTPTPTPEPAAGGEENKDEPAAGGEETSPAVDEVEIWSGETELDWNTESKRVTIDHSKFENAFTGVKITFSTTSAGGAIKLIASDPWTVLTLDQTSVTGNGGTYTEDNGETPVGLNSDTTDGTITIALSEESIALLQGQGKDGAWGGLTIMGANSITITKVSIVGNNLSSGIIWTGTTTLDWEEASKRVTIDHSKFENGFTGVKITFSTTSAGGAIKLIASDPWTVLTLDQTSVTGNGGTYTEDNGETPVGLNSDTTDGTITIALSEESIALLQGQGKDGAWGGLTIMGANSVTITKVELVTE